MNQPLKMDIKYSLITLLIITTLAEGQTRWSRQISSYTSDISDWVPLPGPVERSDFEAPVKRQVPQIAQPRILSEPFPGFSRPAGFNSDFPSRTYFQTPSNRQLYLQSVPSAPQNFLGDQGFGHNLRFGLTQPNFPLSQGFVAPSYNFDNAPQRAQVQQNIKFDAFPKPTLAVSPQAKPFGNAQPLKAPKVDVPKFVDGYRAENLTSTFTFPGSAKKPQSLQKLKQEKLPKPETSSAQKTEREEVQLLYVPVESLNRGQFNFKSPLQAPQQAALTSDVFSSGTPKANAFRQSYATDFHRAAAPLEDYNFGQDFSSIYNTPDQIPKFSTIASPFPTIVSTTSKPKKLKPHQPPLAVFLAQEAKKGDKMKVSDVLLSLKNAQTIAVLDTVSPEHSPKVFIGPSSLSPPESYIKFELPYLSNIENSDKKLRQLPFFVAPLSYNTPDGFAKIPFPSPHVGSVIVNSQIKDAVTVSTPIADVYPNSYTVSSPSHGSKPTQKPTFTYYSTVTPKPNSPSSADPSYYSFEPQTVTSIKPQLQHDVITASPKNPSYFINNNAGFVNFPHTGDNINNNTKKSYLTPSTATNAPPTTTRVSSTTTAPSTYPSALLETHNPYSINQAFHFSTPLDYHSYYEEGKRPVTSGAPVTGPSTRQPSTPSKPIQHKPVPEKQYQSPSPNYAQNYGPEIHYGDQQTSRFPQDSSFTTNVQNKPKVSSIYNQDYATAQRNPVTSNNDISTTTDANVQSTRLPNYYNKYSSADTGDNIDETTAATTTTTTRRTPIRTRGRPHRYTTQKPDNQEGTRAPVTRKPLKERRPLPSRNRYESNRITTERSTRKQHENSDYTTKSTRTRQRGRLQYKPRENEEENREPKAKGKENDLAYQRDVLHQNYPVTLMERMSTVDIEAITDPIPKVTKNQQREPATEVYDTEQAYSAEKVSFSTRPDIKVTETPVISSRTSDVETEAPYYVPRLPPSTRNEEYIYQSRSSPSHIDALSYSDPADKQTYVFTSRSTTPIPKTERTQSIVTETQNPIIDQTVSKHYISDEYTASDEEITTTRPDFEITKISSLHGASSYEGESSEDDTESVPQTTPSHRIRVRPSSKSTQAPTEAPATTTTKRAENKRRPLQPVTYRPAYERRRTTMRIEEIEADLKTKPVHARPDVQERRHPVYRPDLTTVPLVTAIPEVTSKRTQYKRRRPQSPQYTTTSTESSVERKKPTYEVRNRFRGRRPTTERATVRSDSQSETTPTPTRHTPFRYSNRPKLSERYNKRPAPVPVEEEDTTAEDQDSNYSINRPKYVVPDDKTVEEDKWSPKISTDSFKPYNPNDIVEEERLATTERKANEDDASLDIITARSDYEDILIPVTPASNRLNKKIPEIPPTLEALVEQSKSEDSNMSSFESMLEEVMKSLEEQDEDEYTGKVTKHKGGEIGEIPPERVVNSANAKTTTFADEIITTEAVTEADLITGKEEKQEEDRKSKRRGFWKKVKVRPVTTESFEVAESQFYTNTVNRLGDNVKPTKDFNKYYEKRPVVTTYKPKYSLKDLQESAFDEEVTHKFSEPIEETTLDKTKSEEVTTYKSMSDVNPGDLDLGTGTPDPTIMDIIYNIPITETSTTIDRSDGFSLMDYLFGVTASDKVTEEIKEATTVRDEVTDKTEKGTTTESSYIPDEITTSTLIDDETERILEADFGDIKKVNTTIASEKVNDKVEASTKSSFLDPLNIVSTSMSTEISHETEICFRGKCIKTNKDLLL